jgi:hypothetical protein
MTIDLNRQTFLSQAPPPPLSELAPASRRSPGDRMCWPEYTTGQLLRLPDWWASRRFSHLSFTLPSFFLG